MSVKPARIWYLSFYFKSCSKLKLLICQVAMFHLTFYEGACPRACANSKYIDKMLSVFAVILHSCIQYFQIPPKDSCRLQKKMCLQKNNDLFKHFPLSSYHFYTSAQ